MGFLSLNRAGAPSAALEIAVHGVSGAAVERRADGLAVLSHATVPLPSGTLTPSMTTANIQNAPGLADAVARVLERIGKPRQIGLVIPDSVAKVSLVRLEQVPAKRDLDQLMQWQMRKAAPYPIEEAVITYAPGIRAEDGQEFVVSLARRSIVEEYEQVCVTAGAHPGVVDISTFSVLNAMLAARPPDGDWLLVHVAPDYASIAIMRGVHLIFFRSRGTEAGGSLADLVHQTAMYYEDRLQGAGFSRALLSGAADAPADEAEFAHGLEQRLGTPVETVDIRKVAALTDRIAASPFLLDTLAPLVGLLAREGSPGGDRPRASERLSGGTAA